MKAQMVVREVTEVVVRRVTLSTPEDDRRRAQVVLTVEDPAEEFKLGATVAVDVWPAERG